MVVEIDAAELAKQCEALRDEADFMLNGVNLTTILRVQTPENAMVISITGEWMAYDMKAAIGQTFWPGVLYGLFLAATGRAAIVPTKEKMDA